MKRTAYYPLTDYFIITTMENWGSYYENQRNIINSWYKRYLQNRSMAKTSENVQIVPGDGELLEENQSLFFVHR